MYDCVLFDLDGTLTDSASGIISSVNDALTRMGMPLLPKEMQRLYVGPPLLSSFEKLHGMTHAQALEGVRLFRERYAQVGWLENRVYPGIPRLLKSLKARGVRLGVATAKPVQFAQQVLKHFGLEPYFDVISAAPMDESGLPKEELIRRALPAGECRAAMVGDRVYDLDGARRAGVVAIGALYGYGSRDELAGADELCDSVEVLSTTLLGSSGGASGMFISVEGIDGCGKSTQLELLQKWLELCGWRVTATREPGGSPIGERIRELLLTGGDMSPECEALLFAASRAQHVRQTLRPALERGEIVLSDRYLDSSLAYQGAGRELGIELVLELNRAAVDGLMPELTLLFDIDPASARARRQREADRIESERDEFHARVRAGFEQLAAVQPGRIEVLDATLDREALSERVRTITMARLAAAARAAGNELR